MRKLIYVFFAFILVGVVACKEEADPIVAVGNVAKKYYDYLRVGKYDSFVCGMNLPPRVPDSYRSQLTDNAKMFMAQMREEHNGIDSVKVRRAVVDSTGRGASVFLMLHYGDKSVEQVIVPLVKRDSVWLIR